MRGKKKKMSQAMAFIVLFGVVSLFSDMTHEGASSIRGAYLALLGASAGTIGFISGLGELVGYSMRYVFGRLTDKSKRYWPMTVVGYVLDVLAVPANVAAILYNQTEGGVVLLAAGTLGVLYIVEKGGETVTDIASLNGKTIYATGKGATPEYALTYLLSQHGLTLGEDVQVEWKSEPTEIVALMAEQDNAVAMLPQPFVTVAQSQVEGLRVALDLSAEWDALDNGSRLITSVLVARKAFADEHPAALAAFLEDYAASTDYANEHPAEAAVLVEKYGIVKAAVAEKALPQCNLVCITGVDMKVAVGGYLQTLYDLKTEAVGGAMPGDGFYWMGA